LNCSGAGDSGILAGIVIPKVTGRSEDARKTAAVAQIASFSSALDAFEVDNGYYPKGKSGMGDLIVLRGCTNWKGPYLKEIPLDPWQHDYVYECPGSTTRRPTTSCRRDRTGDLAAKMTLQTGQQEVAPPRGPSR